ncbi:MAG: sensor domain-containing diguanylate cyclase [Lachnospiraceae bacterium]|nr:sensor domain-containing diguanylate cyclase [Lachnospiraceae bacterium]
MRLNDIANKKEENAIESIDVSDIDQVEQALSEEKKSGKDAEKGSGEKKKRRIKKRSIGYILVRLSVIPVLVLGVVLSLSMMRILNSSMESELSEKLEIAANSLYNTYSLLAPGNYEMKEGKLYKGEELLTGNYDVVDKLKEAYKLDISLYYGDTRVLTTIMDENGRRVVGTQADQRTVTWVLQRNRKFFAKDLNIGGKHYYGFYVPVLNRDGSVVGMAFAGKETSAAKQVLNMAVMKAGVISALAIIFTLLFCITANKQITRSLHAIQTYLGALAVGNFEHPMPVEVKRREDEIGDMGRYAIQVSQALEKKITTDPLTGMLNRRASNARLQKLLDQVNRDETARLTVTIGDIDFFKSVNDTYGHECGDIVLKKVSEILHEGVKDNGFVARWGGEEFLVVFMAHVDDVLPKLNEILWSIRSFKFEYESYDPFSVTMSFGVNGRVWDKDMEDVIKEADMCLYVGKESGRDRIVVTDGRVLLSDGTYTKAHINLPEKEEPKSENIGQEESKS